MDDDDIEVRIRRDFMAQALFTRNVCVCVCVKREEWFLWQQVTVFILDVNIFKNATSKIKGKRKRYAWQFLYSDRTLMGPVPRLGTGQLAYCIWCGIFHTTRGKGTAPSQGKSKNGFPSHFCRSPMERYFVIDSHWCSPSHNCCNVNALG